MIRAPRFETFSRAALTISGSTPNLPAKSIPTKIAWLKVSGRFALGLEIPPLRIKISPESNPLKSKILPASGEKTFLLKAIHIGRLAFRAPNQGLKSSFCCWNAGQWFAQKECYFHRRRLYGDMAAAANFISILICLLLLYYYYYNLHL